MTANASAGKASFAAESGSPEETRRAADALGRCLAAGDVVLLEGDLGAGKTHFAQGLARGLGVAQVPTSPTFNIVMSYPSGRLPLHHFDLYRLETEEELEDLGIGEYLESGGVCCVEWAGKFPGAFPANVRVDVRKPGEAERRIEARALDERGVRLLDDWARELAGGAPEPEGAGGRASAADEPDSRQEDLPIGDVPGSASGVIEARGGKRIVGALSERPVPGREVRSGADATPMASRSPSRKDEPVVLAFDTANEVVAVGVGVLDAPARAVRPVATREFRAHRASNTTLLPRIDALLDELGVPRQRIACVCVGAGPGSFTGVRIAMATAKGVASALGVGLVAVSSLDAVAWNAQAEGVRGPALVVADAMRKEVYPARFALDDEQAARLTADRVVKAADFAQEAQGWNGTVLGDALTKYRDLFAGVGEAAPEALWNVTGRGLLLALQAAWQGDRADPLDAARHDPAFALPVYTRLSDAEESERARLALSDAKDLATGVQGAQSAQGDAARPARSTMHANSVPAARPDEHGVAYRPLDAAHTADAARIDGAVMGSDAWNARMFEGELVQPNRSWWTAECDGSLAGYAGGLVVDGQLQVLKVAVSPGFRKRGIARELLSRVAEDARNLGARSCLLEVRASNAGAQAFYEAVGLSRQGTRPRYYSDHEDAVIMAGPLPCAERDVAGMRLLHLGESAQSDVGGDADGAPQGTRRRQPLVLAIESSCDETAAAVACGDGLLSDVVASQVDFHARFGGVVPEIASRKHIEAICGVCAEALDCAGGAAGRVTWRDLDAVAATYAPGLVGALVVGVAFAKGAAWALDVPFIGVNHLEGHLYANKMGNDGFRPPAVVSLVSGGNTMLVHMRGWGDYVTLGTTIDDAVGEAFDKVAKALGLGYPGGPVISRAAEQGDPRAIDFPRAMMHSHDLRFSLSGLKTAVVNHINKERAAGRQPNVPDIAASFQQAVIDVQVAKARTALQQTGAPTFCLGGGVAANPALRAAYERMCAQLGVRLVMPPLASCGDNAGMIALVALDRYAQGRFFDLAADAHAHADLDEPY